MRRCAIPAELDDEIVARIILLRALDFTKQEIADELDISPTTVRTHLQQLQDEALTSGKIPAMVVMDRMLGSGVFEWSYEELREDGD